MAARLGLDLTASDRAFSTQPSDAEPSIRIVSLDARYPTHYIRRCVWRRAYVIDDYVGAAPHMPDANLDQSAELEATRKIKQSP